MDLAKAILWDLTDKDRGATLWLLDHTGAQFSATDFRGRDIAQIRDACLTIAAAFHLTLDYRGPPKQILAPERPLIPAAAPEDPPLNLVHPQTQAMLF